MTEEHDKYDEYDRFDQAKAAFKRLKASGKVPSQWPETRTLDEYFGLTSYDLNNKPIERQVANPDQCKAPVSRYGHDETRCLVCGRVWSNDEPRPECERNVRWSK